MEDKIKEIIEREFNAQILEIKRITDGYSHYMYLVKINKEPEEVIIRFSNNKKKDVGLGKEKFIIELLRENNIPAPKIYAFDDEYMVLEKLKGIRLDTIWDSLAKQEKIQVTKEIGKLLSKIHSIKFEEFGKIESEGKIKSDEAFNFRKMGEKPEHDPYLRQYLIDIFDDCARLLSYPHISKEFMEKIISYYIRNLGKIDYDGKATLVHADFMTGHIFVEKTGDEYKITGIIDFEFARSHAPEYDFIKLHRQGFFDDEEIKQALKEGYGEINEQAVEFHRLTRDLGFAWAMVESGNKKLSDEKIKELEEKLNSLI